MLANGVRKYKEAGQDEALRLLNWPVFTSKEIQNEKYPAYAAVLLEMTCAALGSCILVQG